MEKGGNMKRVFERFCMGLKEVKAISLLSVIVHSQAEFVFSLYTVNFFAKLIHYRCTHSLHVKWFEITHSLFNADTKH